MVPVPVAFTAPGKSTTRQRRAVDCQRGQEVTMVGTLRSVETNAKGCAGGVRAEFFDGTDSVTLVWLGQRRIPGIESVRRVSEICDDRRARLTGRPARDFLCSV